MKAMGARSNASRFRLVGLSMLACAVVLAPIDGVGWAAPKPKAKISEDDKYIKSVDISKIAGTPLVLVNAMQEVVVVYPDSEEKRMFFGTDKAMHEQHVYSRSRDGANWMLTSLAPRVDKAGDAAIARRSATEYERLCGGDSVDKFAPMSEQDSAAFLAKAKFFTAALVRSARVLGRDSSGTYYYVDALRREFGGAGYRVFVGRKGAMKQRPLVDVASDTAGMVFSTKSGEIRLVTTTESDNPENIIWYAKGKATKLLKLNTVWESHLIYRELGIYGFLGTLCDSY